MADCTFLSNIADEPGGVIAASHGSITMNRANCVEARIASLEASVRNKLSEGTEAELVRKLKDQHDASQRRIPPQERMEELAQSA